MHHQNGTFVGRPFVQVVHTQPVYLHVVGLKRVIQESFKAFFRGSDKIHRACLVVHYCEGMVDRIVLEQGSRDKRHDLLADMQFRCWRW